jgi:hypothetical protein
MLLVTSGGLLQAQTVQRNRIPQQVIVNGEHVNGAYVPASNGGMQTFTCSSPQQYTTPDGSSQGWACYDQATGVWLLNAIPPASASAQAPATAPLPQQAPLPAPARTAPPVVYQQPTVIYQQPPVVYAAPYPVYPAYPVVVAPAYPSNVILGAAIIGAAGSIASAAIWGSHFYGPYYPRSVVVFRGHR